MAAAATLFALLNVALPATLLFFVATGIWPDPKQADYQTNLIRLIAGSVSAFVFFLAIEIFASRRSSEQAKLSNIDLAHRIASLESRVVPEADGVLKLRDSLSPWMAAIAGARSLDMSGFSLRSFTREHLGSVETMCSSGGVARFLILTPRSEASRMVSRVLLGSDDPADYDAELVASLRQLSELRVKFPKRIQVRTVNYVSAASITVLNRHGQDSSAVVELYTKERSSVRRPHLQLTPAHSPVWYNYFVTQFDELWDSGENMKLEAPDES